MSRFSLAPLVLIGAATGLILAGCGGGGGGSTPNDIVTQKVSGFVFDADTAAPVQGATVKVQGTNIVATTDANGAYTVGPLVPTRKYNMTITGVGYVDDVVTMLSTNATLQGPQVILTKANTPVSITNTTGGTVPSNATLDNNTASLNVPANALPGGAANASISTTLLVGTTVPGSPTDFNKIVHPAVNIGVTGATGNFTLPVTLTFPLAFPQTAGATITVDKLGSDGTWTPVTGSTATVSQDGKSAAFTTTIPGTYGLALAIKATAQVTGTNTQPIAGPYTDPVTVPLTGAALNWTIQDPDGRDVLDSTFTQSQRRGDIAVTGDLDATSLVIHPRGTAQISVVKNNLTVNVTSTGFTIQQAGTSGSASGTIDGLAYYTIVPHQQGAGTGN